MGWNGIHLGYAPSAQEKKSLILQELNSESAERKWNVDKIMQKGSKFYALYSITNKKTGDVNTSVVTALTSVDNGEWLTKIVGSEYDNQVPLSWVEKISDSSVDKDKWIDIIKESNRTKKIVNNAQNGDKMTVKRVADNSEMTITYFARYKKWIVDGEMTYIPKSHLINNLYDISA